MNRYFCQLSRQRPCNVFLHLQRKRARHEYRSSKVVGRQRDRLKTKRVNEAKRKYHLRKRKKFKWKRKNIFRMNSSTMKSKLKYISATDLHKSRSLTSASTKLRTEHSLAQYFPAPPWTDYTTTNHCKSLVRYSNHRLLIYAMPIGTNRPRRKDLIYTLFTLNDTFRT